VQLPAEFLRRGFHFVDTPGLGSAIEENTRITEFFLPEADAFLLVTSYESPLSEEEMRFFRTAASSSRRIFVVLNKQDTVRAQERADALAYVRKELDAMFGPAAPKVFSVSARDGLEAKQSRDSRRLAATGIPALEQELVSFLLTQKRAEFLLRMCDRVAELTRALPNSDGAVGLAEETISVLLETVRAHAEIAFWPNGEQALANCQRLIYMARHFERGASSFRAFVEKLEDDAERGEADEAPIVEEGVEGVRVMTVHKAKGLEFPVVVLAGPTCSAARDTPSRYVDPSRRLWVEPLCGSAPVELLETANEELRRDQTEAVRVAYVAATRARDLW
jgi:superfamily I DNA/RNA helicase